MDVVQRGCYAESQTAKRALALPKIQGLPEYPDMGERKIENGLSKMTAPIFCARRSNKYQDREKGDEGSNKNKQTRNLEIRNMHG